MVLRLLPLALLISATSIAAQVPARTPTRAPTVADTTSGWFGFRQLLRGDTLTVLEVASGSPAERAGLRPGDRILTIDGRTVNERHLNPWPVAVGAHRKLTVVRGNETLTLAMIAESPPTGTLVPSRVALTYPDTVAREARQLRSQMARTATRAATAVPTAVDAAGRTELTSADRRREVMLTDSVRALRRQTEPMIIVDGIPMTRDSLRTPGRAQLLGEELYKELERTLTARERNTETNAVVARLTRAPNAISGAEFEELNPGLAEYFHGVSEGVFVLRVGDASPAAAAGLRPGDIIQAVNDQPVHTISEFRTTVAETPGTITLHVLRKGNPATITLRKE